MPSPRVNAKPTLCHVPWCPTGNNTGAVRVCVFERMRRPSPLNVTELGLFSVNQHACQRWIQSRPCFVPVRAFQSFTRACECFENAQGNAQLVQSTDLLFSFRRCARILENTCAKVICQLKVTSSHKLLVLHLRVSQGHVIAQRLRSNLKRRVQLKLSPHAYNAHTGRV